MTKQINHPKLYEKFKTNDFNNGEFRKVTQRGTGMVAIFKKGYTPIVLYSSETAYQSDIHGGL